MEEGSEVLESPHNRRWPGNPGTGEGKHLNKALTRRPVAEVRRPEQASDNAIIATFHKKQWEIQWETYRRRRAEAHQTLAQRTPLGKTAFKMREGLQKAESTLGFERKE